MYFYEIQKQWEDYCNNTCVQSWWPMATIEDFNAIVDQITEDHLTNLFKYANGILSRRDDFQICNLLNAVTKKFGLDLYTIEGYVSTQQVCETWREILGKLWSDNDA